MTDDTFKKILLLQMLQKKDSGLKSGMNLQTLALLKLLQKKKVETPDNKNPTSPKASA